MRYNIISLEYDYESCTVYILAMVDAPPNCQTKGYRKGIGRANPICCYR